MLLFGLFMSISRRDLGLLGAALYISEGAGMRSYANGRKFYAIEFTNKDPRVIRVFMRFLRRVIKPIEARVKAEMFIYPDLDEISLRDYWSKVTKIPSSRFQKTIVLKAKTGKFKPNPRGTLKIRYTHKEHFLKLQGIISEVFGGVA